MNQNVTDYYWYFPLLSFCFSQISGVNDKEIPIFVTMTAVNSLRRVKLYDTFYDNN